jgi:hypothetical protein
VPAPGPLQRWVVACIDAYQARGGGLRVYGVACNFTPTCSTYTREAVLRFGVLRGLVLGLRRIGRCTERDAVEAISDPVPEQWPRWGRHR